MKGGTPLLRNYAWEAILSVLLVGAIIAAACWSPLYLSFDQIVYSLQQAIGVIGVLAVGFMIVIILGEIDISLPAILAIGTVLLGEFSRSGVPLLLSLPVVLSICTLAGALNGVLIVAFDLPSLAVTLGTMYAYRSIALLIGGVEGYAAKAFMQPYKWLGSKYFFGSLPISLCFLALLLVVFWFILHRTVFGRLMYAVGNNRVATRFSGHNVKAIIISAFAIAGFLSGLAALVYVGQYQSARADNASQLLIFVLACVVLAGFEITGGKGNVLGLVLSLLLIGTLQNGMGLSNVPGPVQTLTIGLILIGALFFPTTIKTVRRALNRDAPKEDDQVDLPSSESSSFQMLNSVEMGSRIATASVGSVRLSLRGLSKSFGGIRALRNVSFDVLAGEIHALVGENGAGKSTLVKIITGLQDADSGEMFLDGKAIHFKSPMEARRVGVLAVYQDPKLFPNLDVAENVFMGIHPLSRFGTVDRKQMYERTKEVLKPLGIELDPRLVVAGLSTPEMQFVEFARALSEGAERLLILDEPTASLTPSETERLFAVIRRLRNRGTSILFISHRLEELEGLVDTITVLRDGEHIATKPSRELSQIEIIKLLVGRTLVDTLYTGRGVMATGGSQTNRRERDQECRPDLKGRELLRVEGLGLSGVFDDISFSVHKEEVVCLAGLVGAGRTEIAKTIFGITPPSHGKVFMQGREIAVRNPRQMLGAGIAYLPEARDLEGLISELSILKNIVLPSIRKIATAGVVSKRREEAIGKRYSASLQIKAANLEDSVSSLSGGNRQKVVISKWLAIDPMVLILDEPTHGIDVGTKAQVHQMMFELADRGIGILMISSDLPEVLRMSDRILVISDGRLAAEFSREEANPVDIMIAAATGKAGT